MSDGNALEKNRRFQEAVALRALRASEAVKLPVLGTASDVVRWRERYRRQHEPNALPDDYVSAATPGEACPYSAGSFQAKVYALGRAARSNGALATSCPYHVLNVRGRCYRNAWLRGWECG